MRLLIRFALIAVLLIAAIPHIGCTDRQVRGNVVAVVTGSVTLAKVIENELPADDPRIVQVVAFREAAQRFLTAFDQAKTAQEKAALVILLADLSSAFTASILPLLERGGTVALTVIAIDTALRFLATYFVNEVNALHVRVSEPYARALGQLSTYAASDSAEIVYNTRGATAAR